MGRCHWAEAGKQALVWSVKTSGQLQQKESMEGRRGGKGLFACLLTWRLDCRQCLKKGLCELQQVCVVENRVEVPGLCIALVVACRLLGCRGDDERSCHPSLLKLVQTAGLLAGLARLHFVPQFHSTRQPGHRKARNCAVLLVLAPVPAAVAAVAVAAVGFSFVLVLVPVSGSAPGCA